MKIGIIGLGLIGGTIAKSLNNHHTITAYDIDSQALSYAINNKIIHKSYDNLELFLRDNNLIYICLYPELIIDFFKNFHSLINDNTLFIEVSGIKTYLINEINKMEFNRFDIIYTHPIAGKELPGVKNSNAHIFKNGNYTIIKNLKNLQKNVDLAYNLAIEMNFKNISFVSEKEHDELIAYSSQLTHLLSLALVNAWDGVLNLSHFTGDSYRDLTRIANINIDLWKTLFLTNKKALIKKITDFETQLHKFKIAIDNDDVVTLSSLMSNAKKLHNERFEGEKK
ncbi:MAG: prephenate dehydrogenase/arogenate dehydrogenase family protein [Candidatus Izemoplasmatales bacterium]